MITEQKYIGKLLQPRVKVIAPYPGGKFDAGEILIPNRLDGKIDNYWVNANPPDRTFIYADVSIYPHLFRLLDWWEDREPEEMPMYVKYHNGNVSCITLGMINAGGIVLEDYTPATETEYNEYINQNK